jgi:hypothetical protein
MNAARGVHSATLLPNGKVLVAGGTINGTDPLASAELFDPATGFWTLASPLPTPRAFHTATLLPNGKVLVVGGGSGTHHGDNSIPGAELYDPTSGSWTNTGAPNIPRGAGHTATLLSDGRVLVVAGGHNSNVTATAELYNPTSGVWTNTGSLTTGPRHSHTATLLPNKSVLIAGGFNQTDSLLSSAEIYDPATGVWSATGSLNVRREWHTATLLPNGRVLIAGGTGPGTGSPAIASAELYDSTTWLATPVMLSSPSKLPGGAFQFAFTSNPNGTNTVLATMNVALPLANWTVLGVVPEFSPGLFLFTDPQATNNPRGFYRVRSP